MAKPRNRPPKTYPQKGLQEMYKNKRYKRKLTQDGLSPKAYELVNDMYGMVISSGLKLKEIRMVCVMLRKKIEYTVAECAVGGREG